MSTAGYFVMPLYLLVPVTLLASVVAYRRRGNAGRQDHATPRQITLDAMMFYACAVLALYANDLFRDARLLDAVPRARAMIEPIFVFLAFVVVAFLITIAYVSARYLYLFLSERLLRCVWYDIGGHMLAIDARYANVEGAPDGARYRTPDGRSRIFLYELVERTGSLPFAPSPESCADFLESRFLLLEADCWERIRVQERTVAGAKLLKLTYAERGGSVVVVNDVIIRPDSALLVRTYLETGAQGSDPDIDATRPWLHYRVPFRLSVPL